jgi:MiaB-like tRNA modifying enzyme
MPQKTIFIETYGCSANQNNSEIMAGLLSQAGFLITNNEELAEIIILNTCVVKSKTESKIKRRIQDLKSKKLVIITGCMPETDIKALRKFNKNLIFLGTHHFKDIVKIIKDYQEINLDEKKQEEYLSQKDEEKLNLPKVPKNKLISIHQISEGCLGECSYCKTRLAKGKLFSYPQESIIKSIESDLQNGAKEIWLTSQDCAAYGLDRGKNELIELLDKIFALKHNFKLRLGMMNPNNVLPIMKDMIEVYQNKKMYKFLHIPAQSASNRVLKDMNRFYSIESVEKIIKSFEKEFPDITIATDIIVGYPTEKEHDHEENLHFIRKFKPSVFNLSKFSSHKKTEAGKLKELPNHAIKHRTSALMQEHRTTARQNKEKFLNKEIEVFIDRKISENLYEARDENYNLILIKTGKENLGKNVSVIIKEIGVHHLIGEIIS